MIQWAGYLANDGHQLDKHSQQSHLQSIFSVQIGVVYRRIIVMAKGMIPGT
jgi:hypothetical protein